MAGNGPAPAEERRRRNDPARGGWQHAAPGGWQLGEVPKPPTGLLKASREAWATWFGAWFAAFWGPEDVPALRQMIRLYDACERGELQRHNELRLAMDTFGITKKGQQDRRWRPPKDDGQPVRRESSEAGGRYGHLRDVSA